MKETLARACIGPHELRLHACGFLRLRPRGGEDGPRGGEGGPRGEGRAGGVTRSLHAAYRAAVLALTSLYLLQELLYAYLVRDDMEALAQVMFLLLCHVTSLCKQIYFHTHADRIDRLIDMLNDEQLNAPGVAGGAGLLAASSARAGRVVRGYSGAALATCALWAGAALAEPAPAFHLYTSLPYATHLPSFIIMFVYVNTVTALVGVANTTMDAFITAFLAQASTQMQILKLEVQCLCEEATELALKENMDYNVAFKRLLVSHLQHYNKIVQMVRSIEDIFGVPIMVQFSIGGWILCMAAYRIVILGGVSLQTASMMMFIVCILTELFLYCYYGNEVTVESASVSWSLYACGWERDDYPRWLPLSLAHTARTLAVRALSLVPLSLGSYLTILKSSYTFYTVLRQTK